jgi:hypothetical protein
LMIVCLEKYDSELLLCSKQRSIILMYASANERGSYRFALIHGIGYHNINPCCCTCHMWFLKLVILKTYKGWQALRERSHFFITLILSWNLDSSYGIGVLL